MCSAEPPEGDLYAIDGFERYRPGIKTPMNAMLFATERLTRMPKGVRVALFCDHVEVPVNPCGRVDAKLFRQALAFAIFHAMPAEIARQILACHAVEGTIHALKRLT